MGLHDDADPFAPWIERWNLSVDGPAFKSQAGGGLIPVLKDGARAMLKVAPGKHARRGAALMAWYAGDGAARVLAHDGPALLLERIEGGRDLVRMARSGDDDDATRLICGVVARLHAARADLPPQLMPLSDWLQPLVVAARQHGGLLTKSAAAAATLFAEARESVPLHGDIHHANILGGGEDSWLAIDPWGLLGERGFDYANLFNNPDIDNAPSLPVATAPGTLAQRLKIVANLSAIEPKRLLMWILAYSGLAASWTLGAGGDPRVALSVVDIAAAALEL